MIRAEEGARILVRDVSDEGWKLLRISLKPDRGPIHPDICSLPNWAHVTKISREFMTVKPAFLGG